MNEPSERRRYSVVRDPVHGDIHLTHEELALLDTPEMQRLRGVRQLGTAYLVYPGAQHTRLEHSLGTLYLTSKLVEAINRNRALKPEKLLGVSTEEERILRAAALVHDITHIPSGHNIEDVRGILDRHDTGERYLRALAAETGAGRELERMGIRREVLAVLLSEEDARERELPEVPAFWRELLSDTICPDILDYLKRDAYFTGLSLVYDERILSYFMVDRESGHLFVDLEKRGMLREDVLSELLRVLDARYFFSERVYYHHAKVAAGAMVAQVVETALLHGGLEKEELYGQTDASLIALLGQQVGAGAGAASSLRIAGAHGEAAEELARARELLLRLASRKLLKRACVFPLYANREVQQPLLDRFFAPGRHDERKSFEREVRIALSRAGHEPVLIQLYCPSRRMQLKEAATHVRFPGADGIEPLATYRDRIPRLSDLEQSYRDLWKLYVFAGTEDPATLAKVAEIVGGLIPGATNVYRPKE